MSVAGLDPEELRNLEQMLEEKEQLVTSLTHVAHLLIRFSQIQDELNSGMAWEKETWHALKRTCPQLRDVRSTVHASRTTSFRSVGYPSHTREGG